MRLMTSPSIPGKHSAHDLQASPVRRRHRVQLLPKIIKETEDGSHTESFHLRPLCHFHPPLACMRRFGGSGRPILICLLIGTRIAIYLSVASLLFGRAMVSHWGFDIFRVSMEGSERDMDLGLLSERVGSLRAQYMRLHAVDMEQISPRVV
ncbi:hypothetical protein BGZ61DRAFT_455259, partial [Ilyonectria robusta]|uniref:uncharacterized protein n=1 Tax=Ilyonectria robusta TaxID=1079257 RepID=UPI001E8D7F35